MTMTMTTMMPATIALRHLSLPLAGASRTRRTAAASRLLQRRGVRAWLLGV